MKFRKTLSILLAGILSVSMLAGCGEQANNSENSSQGGNSSQSEEISGKILLNGSTSMEKVVTALNEVWNSKNPKAPAEGQYTGSGDGIKAVSAGTADIGNSSRELKEEELAEGLVENVIALDGIAVVVNKANKVEDLTIDQLCKIYTGEITNWSEVGGDDKAIVVIGRESNSGTRGAFEELLKLDGKDGNPTCKYGQEINSTGGVMETVNSTEGAIGYTSLADLTDTIKPVKLEGIAPSIETVKSGDYVLQRPFVMATKGEISEQKAQVKAYFDFVKSEEGQEIIEALGLVTVD